MSFKTVIIYKPSVLPYSETFIREQILAYSRWHGILVGHHLTNEIPLNGIDVRLLRSGSSELFDRIRWSFHSRLKTIPGFARDQLQAMHASLFHAHFGTVGVSSWFIARALNLPMLVTLHGSDITIHKSWWENGGGGSRMRSYPEELLSIGRQPGVHFIAVSEGIRNVAVEYGISPTRVSTVHIGIDTEKFAPAGRPVGERKPKVIFIGRLVEKKGCHYLLKAFVSVQKAVPEAELIIIGDGDWRAKLKHATNELQINAKFLGAISSDAVRFHLHSARLLCLPSVTATNGDREGLSTVILEAQACGVPVVTSAFGGATEGIINGKTGFAFPEKRIDELAERLISLLQDDVLAESMSHAARVFVTEKFNIYSCTKRLEALYDKFCGA